MMRNTAIAFLLLASAALSAEASNAAEGTNTATVGSVAAEKGAEKTTSTATGADAAATSPSAATEGTPATTEKKKKVKKSKEPTDKLKKNIEKHMPDPSKPEIANELKCSSCAAVVNELYHRFTDINKAALGRGYASAKDYEFVDSMDYLCKTINKDWGLLVDGDTVTTDFRHRNTAPYQIRTGWVSNYIQDRCADITDKFDQQLIKLGKGKRPQKDWVELTCVVLDKSCASVVDKSEEEL